MTHAAYMRDEVLFPRAATGDGEALLVLVARHGALVRALVANAAGASAATAATAHAFAALATGTLPPVVADWPERLTAAALAAAGTVVPGPEDTTILTALLAALPEPQRAALCAAQAREATSDADTAPLTSLSAPPQAAPGVVPPLLALPHVLPAFPESEPALPVRRGRLDRYVPGRSAARWLAPLAILAVICAYWVGHAAPPAVPTTPTLVAGWPTLPPRATREVAQIEPTVGATSTAPLSVPAAPQTPTAAYGPMSGVIATGVGAPPAAVAPSAPTATEAPLPTATVAATEVAPIATVPMPVAGAPEPTAPPLSTAPPLTRPAPTATVGVPSTIAPPSPTAQASTATAAPTATPPTTAQLALKTQALGFGVELGPRALVFTNPGTDPLTWRAVADSTWLDLAQVSGTLRAGETQSVAINIARGDLPTGGYSGAVQVVTNGGDGTVPVTMTISPSNTVVSAFAEPSVPLGALGCAAPNTYLVSAEIAGKGTPKRAVVYYAINGGTQQTQDLTVEGRRYSTTLGPFSEPGSVVYSLVITEADGNVVRSASNTLTIADCPSRVRTVPVTPPATEPFTLAPGGRNIYTFNTVTPGSLVVRITWQGDATRLSTLLYSPQRPTQPFEQRAGEQTLTFTFPVSAADIAAGGVWALHLVNYESGAATGRLEIAFVPPGAPTPTPQGTAPVTPSVTVGTPAAAPTPTPGAPAPTATPPTPTPAPATLPATATPTVAPATRPASGTPKP